MENITLGDLSSNIVWLVAFIGGILAILTYSKSMLNKVIANPILAKLDKNKKDLESQIRSIKNELTIVGQDQCKNYLVRFFADVENGEKLSEVEIERAYDAYEKYTKTYKGNSYIHDKWEKLMRKENKND